MWIEQWRWEHHEKYLQPGEVLALVVRQEARDVWAVSLETLPEDCVGVAQTTNPDVLARFMTRDEAIRAAVSCHRGHKCKYDFPVYYTDPDGLLTRAETEAPTHA
jgi:hypothetical protein